MMSVSPAPGALRRPADSALFVVGKSMGRYNQFCLFCAAVHFLEGAGLSDRFGSANQPGPVRVAALVVSRAMSDRLVTLPV
jgi:hypothetical protein